MNRKYLTSLLAGLTLLLAPAGAMAAQADSGATLEQLITFDQTAEQTADSTQATADSETATADSEATTTRSTAEATAAEVEGIVAISDTSADSDGSASATALSLGDETVVGGTQEGEGESSGEIFDSGDTELGRLALAAWEAAVDSDSAHSRATFVRLTVIDEDTVDARVLDSYSEATSNGSESYSEGVRITLGGGAENDGLTIVLLRSESSSDGEGSVYLASVNGEEIFNDEQVEGQLCAVDANPLLYVKAICTEADEEVGGNNGGVATVDALDENLHAQVMTSGAAPGADDESGNDAGDDAGDADVPEDDNGDDAGDDADQQPQTEVQAATTDSLPRTGAPAAMGLFGLIALGSGEALRRFRG